MDVVAEKTMKMMTIYRLGRFFALLGCTRLLLLLFVLPVSMFMCAVHVEGVPTQFVFVGDN